jgi:hypothetical protein
MCSYFKWLVFFRSSSIIGMGRRVFFTAQYQNQRLLGQ